MCNDEPAPGDCCEEPLPDLAVKGLECFNAREYFEAHEFLESAWRKEHGQVRELYRGVLQVAVGYYHLTHANFVGARKMFKRSRAWLSAFPDTCQGINLARLRADMNRVEAEMVILGPERIASFDFSLLRPVEFHLSQEG